MPCFPTIRGCRQAPNRSQRLACGLAAGGTDDDGRSAGAKLLDVAERLEWIANSESMAELQQIFTAAYRDARALNDQTAMKQLIDAKDKRKRELR